MKSTVTSREIYEEHRHVPRNPSLQHLRHRQVVSHPSVVSAEANAPAEFERARASNHGPGAGDADARERAK